MEKLITFNFIKNQCQYYKHKNCQAEYCQKTIYCRIKTLDQLEEYVKSKEEFWCHSGNFYEKNKCGHIIKKFKYITCDDCKKNLIKFNLNNL